MDAAQENDVNSLIQDARILLKEGLAEEAVQLCKEYLLENPESGLLNSHLGNLLFAQGKLDEAEDCFKKALQTAPTNIEFHCHLAELLLFQGRYEEAWPHYKWRRNPADLGLDQYPGPAWQGQSLAGKVLLLLAEASPADIIRALPFVRTLKSADTLVVLECQVELIPLLQACPEIDMVVVKGTALPEADYHLPILDLPAVLQGNGVDLTSVDYFCLRLNQSALDQWRPRLGPGGQLRIGIGWHEAAAANELQRPVLTLADFAALADLPATELVILAKSECDIQEIKEFKCKYALTDMTQNPDSFQNLMATAAIMTQMDLVICSDVLLAHLAEALGIPVWLLIDPLVDRPWSLKGALNAGYPPLRIFRQKTPGSWKELVNQVRQQLIREHAKLQQHQSLYKIYDDTELRNLPVWIKQAKQFYAGKDLQACQRICEKILATDPRHPEANKLLGLVYSLKRDYENSLPYLQRAALMQPQQTQTLSNYGLSLYYLKRFREAVKYLQKAVDLDESNAAALSNLGLCLSELWQFDAANQVLRKSLHLNPQLVSSYCTLGNNLTKQGHFAEAEQHFRKALEIQPDHVNSHFNLAFLLLLTGNYRQGWREYQWRLKRPDFGYQTHSSPRWEGQSLADKTLLLLAEQGMGDLLQGLRFIKDIKTDGTLIIVQAHRPLIPLLQACQEIDLLVPLGIPLPEADYHIPVLDLPFVLQSDLTTLAAHYPYLQIDQSRYEEWAQRLGRTDKVRIGIAWQGNPDMQGDGRRSFPLDEFSPLAELATVELISLQKGETGTRQIIKFKEQFALTEPDTELGRERDFMDTAAIMAHMDLVICSDSSVAHLAGALGIPAWLVINTAADWRWLRERDDSPWYPSVRLFRQTEEGDWAEVFRRIRLQLTRTPKESLQQQSGYRLRDNTARSKLAPLYRQAAQAYMQGDFHGSRQLCLEMLAIEPRNFEINELLGMIYVKSANYTEAFQHLKRAAMMKPGHVQVLNNMGLTLCHLSRYEDAKKYLLRATEQDASNAEAKNNLGLALLGLEKPEDAEQVLRQAIALNPDYAQPYDLLGNALDSQDRKSESLDAYKKAVARAPDNEQFLANLAQQYFKMERLDDSEATFSKILELNPNSKEAYLGFGFIKAHKGELTASIHDNEKALRIDPEFAVGYLNLGHSLYQLQRFPEAEAAYRKAISLRPEFVDAHFNLACLLLQKGEFREGWEEYRWRSQRQGITIYKHASPEWSGEDLSNKSIVILSEQGNGDMIQAIRYLSKIKNETTNIILESHDLLAPLFALLPEVSQIIIRGRELPPADYHIPVFNIPAVLSGDINSLSTKEPYLRATPESIREWSARLGKKTGFRAGIVWQGNPKFATDKLRSFSRREFAKIAGMENLQLISLQKGITGTTQIPEFKKHHDLLDVDEGLDRERNFMDTAAIIMNLDLVITSDTSVAHLAGALGAPTWILLSENADWRWFTDREDSPWYPTVRLFRQQESGNWKPLFETVYQALNELINSSEQDRAGMHNA